MIISNPIKIAPFIFLCAIGLLCVLSCKKSKNIGVENNKTQTNSLAATFEISPKTRVFLKDVETEIKKQNTTLIDYNPSQRVVDKYQIQKRDAIYYVSGLAMLKKDTDPKKLGEMGFLVGSQTKTFTSIEIPLKRLDIFLNLEVIEYFEISDKVNLN